MERLPAPPPNDEGLRRMTGFHPGTVPYQTGGARAFATDHYNAASTDTMAASIAEVNLIESKKVAFWSGKSEYRGVTGGALTVVVEHPPGFYGLEVPRGTPEGKTASYIKYLEPEWCR